MTVLATKYRLRCLYIDLKEGGRQYGILFLIHRVQVRNKVYCVLCTVYLRLTINGAIFENLPMKTVVL
jgi:hypothetical protein